MRRQVLFLLTILSQIVLFAQQDQLTLEKIWAGEFRTQGLAELRSMNDGKFYINELQWSCSNVLVSGAVLDAGFGRRQLCEGVGVTLQDRFGGFDNAQCYLGKFTPLRLATQADAQQSNAGEVIVLNEGQDIRRAQLRRRQR